MLGDKIRKLMKEKGIKKQELSEKSGVPISTLNKILYGETASPSLDKIQALAKVLGCTLDDFSDSAEPKTIAAHHDGEDWTEEELNEIEKFKAYVRSQRKE